MSVSITQDIKSVTDLKKRTNEIFRQIQRTGRPVIITVTAQTPENGEYLDYGSSVTIEIEEEAPPGEGAGD